MLLVQAEKPLVIFRRRIIGEDHGNVSICGLHYQRLSGPGSDHPFNFGFVAAKSRYGCQEEQCQQTYNSFPVHSCLSLFCVLEFQTEMSVCSSFSKTTHCLVRPCLRSAQINNVILTGFSPATLRIPRKG